MYKKGRKFMKKTICTVLQRIALVSRIVEWLDWHGFWLCQFSF